MVKRWSGDNLFPVESSRLVTIPLIVETKQLRSKTAIPKDVP